MNKASYFSYMIVILLASVLSGCSNPPATNSKNSHDSESNEKGNEQSSAKKTTSATQSTDVTSTTKDQKEKKQTNNRYPELLPVNDKLIEIASEHVLQHRRPDYEIVSDLHKALLCQGRIDEAIAFFDESRVTLLYPDYLNEDFLQRIRLRYYREIPEMPAELNDAESFNWLGEACRAFAARKQPEKGFRLLDDRIGENDLDWTRSVLHGVILNQIENKDHQGVKQTLVQLRRLADSLNFTFVTRYEILCEIIEWGATTELDEKLRADRDKFEQLTRDIVNGKEKRIGDSSDKRTIVEQMAAYHNLVLKEGDVERAQAFVELSIKAKEKFDVTNIGSRNADLLRFKSGQPELATRWMLSSFRSSLERRSEINFALDDEPEEDKFTPIDITGRFSDPPYARSFNNAIQTENAELAETMLKEIPSMKYKARTALYLAEKGQKELGSSELFKNLIWLDDFDELPLMMKLVLKLELNRAFKNETRCNEICKRIVNELVSQTGDKDKSTFAQHFADCEYFEFAYQIARSIKAEKNQLKNMAYIAYRRSLANSKLPRQWLDF